MNKKKRLGRAWTAAEEALPKHWRLSVVPYYPKGYEAEAHDLRHSLGGRDRYGSGTTGPYPTPAEALIALRSMLEERFSRKTRR